MQIHKAKLSPLKLYADGWADRQRHIARKILFAMGAIALTSAAFLRWFS